MYILITYMIYSMNRIKIILLGEQNSGKTQSIQHLINEQPIYKDPLISLYHKSIDIHDLSIIITILDTKSKLNNALTFIPLSDVDHILIFTNLSIPHADERVNEWVAFCKKYIPAKPIVVIGTVKKNNNTVEQNIHDLEHNVLDMDMMYTININEVTEIHEMYQTIIEEFLSSNEKIDNN
jgi:GTPase SAR1 family protein